MVAAVPLLGTRLLGKPGYFTGDEKKISFYEWSYTFTQACYGIDEQLGVWMDQAADHPTEIVLANWWQDAQYKAGVLMTILSTPGVCMSFRHSCRSRCMSHSKRIFMGTAQSAKGM